MQKKCIIKNKGLSVKKPQQNILRHFSILGAVSLGPSLGCRLSWLLVISAHPDSLIKAVGAVSKRTGQNRPKGRL